MAYGYKMCKDNRENLLMHLGFQNNSYNINAQVKYKLGTIIKQKMKDKVDMH
jgi:hypothetical protein